MIIIFVEIHLVNDLIFLPEFYAKRWFTYCILLLNLDLELYNVTHLIYRLCEQRLGMSE